MTEADLDEVRRILRDEVIEGPGRVHYLEDFPDGVPGPMGLVADMSGRLYWGTIGDTELCDPPMDIIWEGESDPDLSEVG